MRIQRRLRGGPAGVALALAAALAALPACDSDEGYIEVTLKAKDRAEQVACQAQLRALGTHLNKYAMMHEAKFPPSLAELKLSAQDLGCPGPRGKAYVYVSGQGMASPPDNVLVYEAEPAHGETCNVLFVDGSVKGLTPTELAGALAPTKPAD